jgi:hypothetical protein
MFLCGAESQHARPHFLESREASLHQVNDFMLLQFGILKREKDPGQSP